MNFRLRRQVVSLYPQWYWRILISIKWLISYPAYELINKESPSFGRFLEVGSSFGLLANLLSLVPSRDVRGIDISQRKITFTLQTVRQKKNIRFLCADALKFKEKNFEVIIMSDFLHHVDFRAQNQLIAQVHRQLPKGGLLMIKEVQKNLFSIPFLIIYLIDRFINFGHSLYYRNKKDYLIQINRVGFKLKKCQIVKNSFLGEEFLIIGQKT